MNIIYPGKPLVMGPELVRAFFRVKDLPTLLQHRQNYQKILAEAKGEIPCHHPMPWMIPSWEHGLKILNEVIAEKELNQNQPCESK